MRVHHVASARKAKKPRKCRRCGHEIAPKESYKWAEPRFGPILIWCKDHSPKRSELSSSKLGPVWDAIDEFDPAQHDSVEDLTSALEAIGDTANEVADEYEEGINNMPEGLQEGHVAEESREKVEALQSFAEELSNWEPDIEEVTTCEECDTELQDGLVCQECEHEHEDPIDAAREQASDVVNNFDY